MHQQIGNKSAIGVVEIKRKAVAQHWYLFHMLDNSSYWFISYLRQDCYVWYASTKHLEQGPCLWVSLLDININKHWITTGKQSPMLRHGLPSLFEIVVFFFFSFKWKIIVVIRRTLHFNNCVFFQKASILEISYTNQIQLLQEETVPIQSNIPFMYADIINTKHIAFIKL